MRVFAMKLGITRTGICEEFGVYVCMCVFGIRTVIGMCMYVCVLPKKDSTTHVEASG